MGKYFSKTVIKWLRLFGIQSYSSSKKEVKYFKTIPKTYNLEEILSPLKLQTTYPLLIGMHFVRGSKHVWDFNNATHIILDLLTALDIIPDDDVTHILPFPLLLNNSYWSYDKDNPGVYISVL